MGWRVRHEIEVKYIATFFSLCVLLLTNSSLAQSSVTDGIIINADSMYRDLEKRTFRAEGNVQVVFQGQHLSCDRAKVDLKKQQIEASGNVILKSEKAHIEGERIVFNYKQNTGIIFKGFVQSGQVVFEGDFVEKVGEDRYIAKNAKYTACDTCPPAWSFSGRQIDAEIGGYARIKRPVFRVAGVPIMILPGIIVPLKSARQSGFLVPFLDLPGRSEVAPGQSYFWAIDKSQDLTTTVQWFSLRGLKTEGDYRYVLSPESRGRLRGAWLKDRIFSEDQDLDTTYDRWFADYSHHNELPNGYTHRMQYTGISDLHFPRDFPDEVPGYGNAAIENRMSISKLTENQSFSAEAATYTNYLKTNPLDNNDDVVSRFPEIRYSVKERQVFDQGPLFNMDVNYANFVRGKHNYDDLKLNSNNTLEPIGYGPTGEILRDGVYDPATDIFRTGQRIDLRPTLSYPFQLWRKFDLLPRISYRETQYRFYPTNSAENPTTGDPGFSPTAARRYVQTDISIRTEFTRVFGDLKNPLSNRWKHSIEPELTYSQIPWKREPNHPFFGVFDGQQHSRQYEAITDADIASRPKLQFDYEDRTYNKQVVDFGLTNRLTRKVWRNGNPDYETAVLFRLSQAYDINEANSETPHPWSSVRGLLDARFEHFETYTTANYNGYARVADVASRVRGIISPRNYLEVTYTRNYNLTENYEVAPNGETRNVGVGGGFLSKYFEFEGRLNWEARKFEVLSWEYLFNIRPPGRCWAIKFGQTLIPNGDPYAKFSFNFDFGGENKPTVFRE